MCHSDFGGSDQILDIMIHNAREKLTLLTELKTRRQAEKKKSHYAVTSTPILRGVYKGRIGTVECNCGEITKYRKPIRVLDDFKCPKDKG